MSRYWCLKINRHPETEIQRCIAGTMIVEPETKGLGWDPVLRYPVSATETPCISYHTESNTFWNNLIFFMFIRFPAILLLKQWIHISMNFVHWVFYITIFSNMAQRQKARYSVARYVIVNNVTTTTLESMTKNAWKRHWQKRNGNSLNSLYLGVSNSFKDGSSQLNNHSAVAVGKFILALSVQFEFCFILRLFALRFCMKMIWNWIIRTDSFFFFVFFFLVSRYEWKTDVHIFVARHTMCTSVFSFIHWGMNEKTDVHIFRMAAMPAIQCARRFFHSYIRKRKKSTINS